MWRMALLAGMGCGGAPATPQEGCAGMGAVRSIDAAVARVEQMPEPTIPCFVASLPRPLEVVAVASLFSAQPGNARDPRFFVMNDDLVVSVVSAGTGLNLLELGEWEVPGETSLKGELVFPIEGEVDPFHHLSYGSGSTCGLCHVGERAAVGVPGAFVSEVIRPSLGSRIELDDVWRETLACDDEQTPERCAILDAVMGDNDVVEGAFS
jgi:hypothetical protein